MKLFKKLTPDQETEFRQWAHDNYTPFEPILGIWHPTTCDECVKINRKAELFNHAEGLPEPRQWEVTAKQITSFKELDHDDQECLAMIIDPFVINAVSEEKALDVYHSTIPIACLEDFDISCRCID